MWTDRCNYSHRNQWGPFYLHYIRMRTTTERCSLPLSVPIFLSPSVPFMTSATLFWCHSLFWCHYTLQIFQVQFGFLLGRKPFHLVFAPSILSSILRLIFEWQAKPKGVIVSTSTLPLNTMVLHVGVPLLHFILKFSIDKVAKN